MTERRREAVRMEIARAAVRLFTEHGVSGTTGDDIARELGISTRTVWRYFPTKESCVRPLLTTGLDFMAARLRACPPDTPLLEHLEREQAVEDGAPDLEEPVADLIRMTHTEPGLMAVWLEVHHAAESVFAEIIAARTGEPADDLAVRVQAAILNTALRLASEELAHSAAGGPADSPEGVAPFVRTVLAMAARGLPAFTGAPTNDLR
ncbi:TetR/AcrR family transcriptional regulator [Nocardiopsis sp. NRRL B-16309]|uniref:TetR/AcrR family transcriptional regulator n=1 Tax=Nocardiopsis sp. NRRL B-16309 TaxID=1519494 RepID=UPI0006AF8DD7|nr:TetR/AcrR family transcriptional regulator [Nocardiopsis sp. NRRL B-16309]KOX11888.1 TetR family transcriptional regulator [Nocardiopsis sp. NRRL B-16309]